MRNWELDNCVCNIIYHPWYGRYKSSTAVWIPPNEEFRTQSVRLNPWFLISARIVQIILIFIFHLSLYHPQLSHHCRTQSSVIPLYLSMAWPWVNTIFSINKVEHTTSTAYTDYSIHRLQHTPTTAYTNNTVHRLQHTPTTAYTDYSVHRLQRTPTTAYTDYSIHRLQRTLTTA